MRFFNKIRKTLIINANFKKYLLYAIGEILLIMLGIIFALQVSNWNENRKTKTEVKTYLSELKKEMKDNLKLLKVRMDQNQANVEAAQQLLQLMGKDTSTVTNLQLSKLTMGALMANYQYDPTSSVLQEIINTGNLKNIPNPELRRFLASWEAKLQLIKSQEQEVTNYHQMCIDFIIKKGNFRRLFDDTELTPVIKIEPIKNSSSNLNLLQSVEFESSLLLFTATSHFLNPMFYEPFLKELKEHLVLLEELK